MSTTTERIHKEDEVKSQPKTDTLDSWYVPEDTEVPTPTLRKTFELVKPIMDYLYGYSLIAVSVVVNTLTLNLKLKDDEATNSLLLILPKGCGKNALLTLILQRSNKIWFPWIPEKLFESEILDMPIENFKGKVWIVEDLIVSFRGNNTKQREQLMGFFIAFLSKGMYSRQRKTVEGRIVCLFGYEKENYKKYQKQMFTSTFEDRFMSVKLDFDVKTKRAILNERDKNKSIPKVNLPLRKRQVDVSIPSTFNDEINDIALELDKKGAMSFVRAQTFIKNFLKANAHLNGRSDVCEDDLRLFKLVIPLHYGTSTNKIHTQVRMFILEESINSRAVKGREVKDQVMNKTGCSESAVKKVLSELKSQGIVQLKKISLQNGYDYLYWI